MELYEDDPGVLNTECLWRRIPPTLDLLVWDEDKNQYRPQSGLYSDSRGGTPMSVGRANAYNSPDEMLVDKGYPDHLLVAINVGFLRNIGLVIASDPPTDDPGHIWVVGKKTAGVKKKISRNVIWVVPPEFDPPS